MDEAQLVANLKRHYSDQDTSNFDVLDFIHAFGSPLDALMYSRLFWPEFVEIHGMVFLKGTMENDEDQRRLEEAIEYYGGDRRKIERSFNLVEVPHCFGKNMGDTTDEEDLWLAERLSEMWSARLQRLYPDRRFEVEVLNPDDTDDVDVVCIWFYSQE